MANDVTDDILRSGVPHAVETSVVTRHAINPRHVFLDSDPTAEKAESTDAPLGDQTSFADNWQKVPQQTHHTDTQTLGKEHLQDNSQAIHKDRVSDNRQSLGATQVIEEKKLYLEKKSIQDNRQKVAEKAVQRAAPPWAVQPDDVVPKSDNLRRTLKGRGANASLIAEPVTLPLSKIHDDDALKARMQKLRAKVRDVNEVLSDLDPDPTLE